MVQSNPNNKIALLQCWLGFLVLISLCFSCAPKQEQAQAVASLIQEGWQPSLEQVQDELQESFGREMRKSQQGLNRASKAFADLLDARLFITYVRLMDILDQPARSELFNEQENWLAKRNDIAQAAVTSKRGSLAPLEYSGAYRKITEERLAQLEKRLAGKR